MKKLFKYNFLLCAVASSLLLLGQKDIWAQEDETATEEEAEMPEATDGETTTPATTADTTIASATATTIPATTVTASTPATATTTEPSATAASTTITSAATTSVHLQPTTVQTQPVQQVAKTPLRKGAAARPTIAQGAKPDVIEAKKELTAPLAKEQPQQGSSTTYSRSPLTQAAKGAALKQLQDDLKGKKAAVGRFATKLESSDTKASQKEKLQKRKMIEIKSKGK